VTSDPFLHLAVVGGSTAPQACAHATRALVSERLPDHPFDAAVRIKRLLAARGFRDDATAFALPDMLERRAGNCLGLTLLISAVLLDRGHEVAFMVRLDPLDDVHDAGLEFFARLHDPVRGVDCDSRLPEARDRAARYRFVPVETMGVNLAPLMTPVVRCSRAERPELPELPELDDDDEAPWRSKVARR
jgi:hypothetical protein